MTAARRTRAASAVLLAVALVALWQAWPLERWSFDGPGAGFFPQLVAALCALLAATVLVMPGRRAAGTDDEAGDEEGGDGDGGDRRTLAVYGVALLVLALGAMVAGFAVTAVAITVVVMRFAERRGWLASIGFGVACALIGLVVFGWLLRVDLPQGRVDEAVLALLRR